MGNTISLLIICLHFRLGELGIISESTQQQLFRDNERIKWYCDDYYDYDYYDYNDYDHDDDDDNDDYS